MTLIQPLDLQQLLVGTLAGTWMIFFFLAMGVIAAMSAKFKMPVLIFGFIVALFMVMMSSFYAGIWALFLCLAGLFVGYQIVRIMRA